MEEIWIKYMKDFFFTSAAVWLLNLPLFLIILIATLALVAIFLHFATNPYVPCPTKDCTRYSEVVECSTSPTTTLPELLHTIDMLRKKLMLKLVNRLNCRRKSCSTSKARPCFHHQSSFADVIYFKDQRVQTLWSWIKKNNANMKLLKCVTQTHKNRKL